MESPLQILDRIREYPFENQHPNSYFSNQPIAPICQKETIDSVTELNKLFNPDIVSLNGTGSIF